HLAQLPPERLDRLVDVPLQALDDVVHHGFPSDIADDYVVRAAGPRRGSRRSSSTSVPSGSPSTTRRMLPGFVMLKTRMGRLLSRQREMAVESITPTALFST